VGASSNLVSHCSDRSGSASNIQPFAVAELAALGLSEALAASSIPTRENLHLDNTGTVLWADSRSLAAGDRHPQYSIHRGELHMLLLAAVRDRLGPDVVRTGVRLHSFTQRRSSVRAYTQGRATGTVTVYEAAVVIGAGGLHSTVRAHPPWSTGCASSALARRSTLETPTGTDESVSMTYCRTTSAGTLTGWTSPDCSRAAARRRRLAGRERVRQHAQEPVRPCGHFRP
jgi:5-methylphenazine-1-carboxylate 1-monooxygenase